MKHENKNLKDEQTRLKKQIFDQTHEIVRIGNQATGLYDQLQISTRERESLQRERAAGEERYRALKEKHEDTVKEMKSEIGTWKWKYEEGQKDNVDLREYINGLSKPREGVFAEDYYVKLFDGLNNRYEPPFHGLETVDLVPLGLNLTVSSLGLLPIFLTTLYSFEFPSPLLPSLSLHAIPPPPPLLTLVSAPGSPSTPRQTPKNPFHPQPKLKFSTTSPPSARTANTLPSPSNKHSSRYTKAGKLEFPCSVTVLPLCCMRCVSIDLRSGVLAKRAPFSGELKMISLRKVGDLYSLQVE